MNVLVTATLCINKILLNNYLNLTLQSLHYYCFNMMFLRVKSWKSWVIRSFHTKFRKKSWIVQNQEKSGIIRKIRKCLTDWEIHGNNEQKTIPLICRFGGARHKDSSCHSLAVGSIHTKTDDGQNFITGRNIQLGQILKVWYQLVYECSSIE